jgi:hypothetical protein
LRGGKAVSAAAAALESEFLTEGTVPEYPGRVLFSRAPG